MSLVPADSRLPDGQIDDLLKDFRDGLSELVASVEEGTYGPPGAGRLRTAAELGRSVVALLDLALETGSARNLRIAAVNLGHDGLVALIDIAKSQSGRSVVPAKR